MEYIDVQKILSQERKIKIEKVEIGDTHLSFKFSLNNKFVFDTRVCYFNKEIESLRKAYDLETLNFLFAHMALFETLKFMMIFPDEVDVSLIETYITPESISYMENTISLLYSQHIYENKRFDWKKPQFIFNKENLKSKNPIEIDFKKLGLNENDRPFLISNGGGKDSFLSMKLINDGKFKFSIFTHGRSEYGRCDHQYKYQHRLSDFFIKTYNHENNKDIQKHQVWIHDDFTDGIFTTINFKDIVGECVQGKPCQVGFPEMIFDSLPFVLLYGYKYFILGNERSANSTQVENSKELGLDTINHQYLKSYDSEKRLNELLKFIIKDFSIFSVLRPVYDYKIYKNISKYPEILPYVHSCNVHKPWCSSCSKCAYVFCHFNSVYDPELILKEFGQNLFDRDDLIKYWKQLLGLDTQNAFECVGEIDELRNAMYICATKKGLKGKAIDLFFEHGLDKIDYEALEKKYDNVFLDDICIPDEVLTKIKDFY